jgi:hypothetical protein
MEEEEMILAMLGICALFGFGWIVVHHVYRAFKVWFEIALKRDMVARGYSAQEIIAVVATDRRCRVKSPLPDVPPAKPIRQPAYMP